MSTYPPIMLPWCEATEGCVLQKGHIGTCAVVTADDLKLPEGQKADTDKLRFDLLPFEQLEEVVAVLTFGAAKYGAENWKKVPDARRRYLAALLRHVSAYAQFELEDKESGLHHLAHAICCALFIMHFDEKDASP